jgi:hypothetical protein
MPVPGLHLLIDKRAMSFEPEAAIGLEHLLNALEKNGALHLVESSNNLPELDEMIAFLIEHGHELGPRRRRVVSKLLAGDVITEFLLLVERVLNGVLQAVLRIERLLGRQPVHQLAGRAELRVLPSGAVSRMSAASTTTADSPVQGFWFNP